MEKPPVGDMSSSSICFAVFALMYLNRTGDVVEDAEAADVWVCGDMVVVMVEYRRGKR